MNTIVEKLLKEHLPEASTSKLSFVKFNTAGSPFRGYPKVLFFSFFGDEREPRWCLKTVRTPQNNATISKAFSNLQMLNALAGNDGLFARAIWTGELDGVMWSIEEAAPGRRPTGADIPSVMQAYIAFQKKVGVIRSMPAKEKAESLIRELDLAGTEMSEARRLCDDNCTGDIALIPQHGDFTQDNALIEQDRVTLIDCDSFMPEGIAGFDLFQFLSRAKQQPQEISEYFRAYHDALGLPREFGTGDFLVWILQERVLKKIQGAPREKQSLSTTLERSRATLGL